ncbi:ATP-binding protein [Sphaerimonospora thailandensis]|uniref:ArsR family transcriptional regulator n=1 Tax=Sphaerimonospora thailandensis TaxID=795644 RepID=A0A8J3R617_9ACTN|nr:ATP-binding protein [Sphaerimonospora thailandensis]GIH69926.1 ArsR family transcriptional regulator [Sphaerimonospora thailandensis]
MGFVNRTKELAALEDWWAQPYPRPGLIWGRRRVGKTSLIRRFAEGRRLVFYTGAGSAPAFELAQFSREVAAALPDGLRRLDVNPYRDWYDAFEHLAAQAEQEPLLLVLDEFPELTAMSPDLPGIMRAVLDRIQGRTKLRILLSGSSVRAMWEMQEYRAPLYGRFDLTLQLHPFRPHEAALMLPRLSPEDRARVYGIVGGVPLYLSLWDQGGSIESNLLRLAMRPGAPLYNEGRLILATELGGGHQPSAVLDAIAAGRTRFHEIGDAVGSDPTRTLDRLVELRLVERLIPVTEDERKSRRKIYRIADNFLAFYLGPLMRNRSKIEIGLGETILPVIVEGLDDHMGEIYEEAFRDHLRRRAAEIDPRVVAIGPWWEADGQNQIDAVVLSGRGREPVLAGESKWATTVQAGRIMPKLMAKAARLVPDPGPLRYAICARTEVKDADPEILTVTAADIFSPD